MSKKIYIPDSENIARRVKKIYIPVDGVAHKVKKIYVGDAENKARQCFSSEYVWKKYVSKEVSSENVYTYTGPTSYARTINIWPEPDLDFSGVDIRFDNYYFTVGTGYRFDENAGEFILYNSEDITLYKNVSPSQHDIDFYFGNKWIKELDGISIWKVGSTANSDLRTLKLTHRCDRDAFMKTKRKYTYEYVGDVTSENENAYTSGTVGDYYSFYADDIRTVYIRKE